MNATSTTLPAAPSAPYWHGGPAETSERTLGHDPESRAFWSGRIARRCASQMRDLAAAMPDSAPRASERRACLLARAAEIDAGQFSPIHNFRVFVPYYRKTPKGRRTQKILSYPCRGCFLYTFDEAWLLMESFSAKRGGEFTGELSCWAEGRNQNLALDYIYDGIAEPNREVAGESEREAS